MEDRHFWKQRPVFRLSDDQLNQMLKHGLTNEMDEAAKMEDIKKESKNHMEAKLTMPDLEDSLLKDMTDDFFEKSRLEIASGSLDLEDMKEAFRRFISARIIDQEKDFEKGELEKLKEDELQYPKIKDCLGPADVCHNCQSKGEIDGKFKELSSTFRSSVASQVFKRCSGCHLVAYCSEDCQKEHWLNNHKLMCRIFTGKKKIGTYLHTFEDCNSCRQGIWAKPEDPADPFIPCEVKQVQVYLMICFWRQFGYHNGSPCPCPEELRKCRDLNLRYPMQPPWVMGEISGSYQGWIDQYLSILCQYITAIKAKYTKEIEKFEIEEPLQIVSLFLLRMRSRYWYYITNEKQRYMSELMFSLDFIEERPMERDGQQQLFPIDHALRKLENKEGPNVWWETFLNHLNLFYHRLRGAPHLVFKADNIPDHKKKDFEYLKEVHDIALSRLRASVEMCLPKPTPRRTDPIPPYLIPDFFPHLLEGDKCVSCGKDLSRELAQIQVHEDLPNWTGQQSDKGASMVFPKKSMCYTRFPELPIIFLGPKRHVSCGKKVDCVQSALKIQWKQYENLAKEHVRFLFSSQKCQGCLQFCLESHRCSGCRAVRYCSQDCLEKDWKVHEETCMKLSAEAAAPVEEKSLRKLNEDEKKEHFNKCINWLGKCDPIFTVIINTWRDDNTVMNDILVTHTKEKKTKKGKKGQKSVASNELADETPRKGTYDKNKTEKPTEKKKKKNLDVSGKENAVKVQQEVNNSGINIKPETEEKINDSSKKAAEEKSLKKKTKDNVVNNVKSENNATEGSKQRKKISEMRANKDEVDKTKLEKDKLNHDKLDNDKLDIDKPVNDKVAKDKIDKEILEKNRLGFLSDLISCVTNNNPSVKVLVVDLSREFHGGKPNKSRSMTAIENKDDPKLKEFCASLEHKTCKNGSKSTEEDTDDSEECCAECGRNIGEVIEEKDLKKEELKKEVKKETLIDPKREETSPPEPIKAQNLDIKPDNLEKVKKIVDHHRMGHMHGRHFEIRHIEKQVSLNESVCKVVDGEKKAGIFDPRVVVQVRGQERQISLKQRNLVDICADIDDIKNTKCAEGHIFRDCDKPLKPSYVTKLLKKLVSWAQAPATRQDRPDQLHRLNLLQKYLKGEVTSLACKDNPDFTSLTSLTEEQTFSACLAAVRPGCVGDTKVHFSRFNQLVCECDLQLVKRFREYIVSGMCHACQAYYIERQEVEQAAPYGSVFVKCSRVKSLDGLELRAA